MRNKTQMASAAPSGASPDAAERGDPAAHGEQQRRAAESGGDDAGHGLGDPSENDAIHQQAEIDGAEAAQEGGGLAAVTDLGKLHVGEQSAAPPEAGEEEDGHHAGEQRSPPEPVSADALGIDEAGDDQRSVGGKGGGDHGGSGQPPVHVAPGDKVVIHAFCGALAEAEAEQDGDCKIPEDGQPIEKRESHRIRRRLRWALRSRVRGKGRLATGTGQQMALRSPTRAAPAAGAWASRKANTRAGRDGSEAISRSRDSRLNHRAACRKHPTAPIAFEGKSLRIPRRSTAER